MYNVDVRVWGFDFKIAKVKPVGPGVSLLKGLHLLQPSVVARSTRPPLGGSCLPATRPPMTTTSTAPGS